MNEITDRLAAGLADLGVKKGDRVGIFMPNTPQFVMAYFAILKARRSGGGHQSTLQPARDRAPGQ